MKRATRFPPLRRDPNGKPLCRGCGGPVPKGRLTWCSRECQKRYHPWYVIQAVNARDKGYCQICGKDLFQSITLYDGKVVRRKPRRSEIEYDHIIPFSEGGQTVLENMRTLCRQCHKRVTAEWRKQKAKS